MVVSAKQFTNRPDQFKEVDETTEYILKFSNGLEAKGRTSVGESINHLRVNCAKGWYEMRPMQTYSRVSGSRSDGVLINEYLKNQQAKQMDDDALAILNNQNVMVPGIEGLKDVNIINAIIKSAQQRKEVEIKTI